MKCPAHAVRIVALAVLVGAVLTGCAQSAPPSGETKSTASTTRGASLAPTPSPSPVTSPEDGGQASTDAAAACTILKNSSTSFTGGFQSPWSLAVVAADADASKASLVDARWQKLSGDLTLLEVTALPGNSLPPAPLTGSTIRKYWAIYTPLVADCAPLGIALRTIQSAH